MSYKGVLPAFWRLRRASKCLGLLIDVLIAIYIPEFLCFLWYLILAKTYYSDQPIFFPCKDTSPQEFQS